MLSDVIDAVFTLPGSAQLRWMRVHRFLTSWSNVQCGGEPVPLDSTADRFNQDLFPDLDLIREKGFSEPIVQEDAGRASCQPGDKIAAAAPDFWDWLELSAPWDDLADSVRQDEKLVALLEPMSACLHDESGLEVDADDPVRSYLNAVNYAGSDGATAEEQKQFGVAYADCAGDYFALFRELLLHKRPELIERNRELLERFARQLVALGYVP